MRPKYTSAAPVCARAGRRKTRRAKRRASAVVAIALLALTAGCAEETTKKKASGPEPTATATPLRLAAHSGLWTTAQACAAITHDGAQDLATVLSFMEAQPPDMDHVVAAEAVADDFHELGAGTEGPLGDHLTDLASEVHALIAELWEAGDDWAVADATFDMTYFDAAVVGLAEECPTPAAP